MSLPVMDYLLISLAGLLGTPHCIGMCGGIMSAWTLHSPAAPIQTMIAYNSGRIITYMAVGGFMGFIGSFVEALGKVVGIQGMVNILGGVFILVWIFKKYTLPLAKWSPLQFKPVKKMMNENQTKTGLIPVFISGLLLGFLPCGLTYTMHMKAASTASVSEGVLTLAFFGLGTLPAMFFIGLFSILLSRALRRKILLFANSLAIFIGVILILRGMSVNGWIPSVNPWLW